MCVCVSTTGQVGLVAGLLFAFLVVLPGVLLLFYCYRIKSSYYHKWLSQREKNKKNKSKKYRLSLLSLSLLTTHVHDPLWSHPNMYTAVYSSLHCHWFFLVSYHKQRYIQD